MIYMHNFQYVAILHFLLMGALAVYFLPWGLLLVPVILLQMALFMVPGDLRFSGEGKRRRIAVLYKTSLLVNGAVFSLGLYFLFVAWVLGLAFLFIAGMNLAVANGAGRALKNIARHPPSPFARSEEENRALETAAFWEKFSYFTDTAFAIYVGGMAAATLSQISTAAMLAIWGKWIWLGIPILAAPFVVRSRRCRVLEAATEAAVRHKGDDAVAAQAAFLLNGKPVPAVAHRTVTGGEGRRRGSGGYVGETHAPLSGEDRKDLHRQFRRRGAGQAGYGQWALLLVWTALTLHGFICLFFLRLSYYPSVLSYKTGFLVMGLAVSLCLWGMAARIHRNPHGFARERARETFLDRMFILAGFFAGVPFLLALPLYALSHMAHGLTGKTVMETHQVAFPPREQPCLVFQEENRHFCIRDPQTYAVALKEGKTLTFAVSYSPFGTSVDDYVPSVKERE